MEIGLAARGGCRPRIDCLLGQEALYYIRAVKVARDLCPSPRLSCLQGGIRVDAGTRPNYRVQYNPSRCFLDILASPTFSGMLQSAGTHTAHGSDWMREGELLHLDNVITRVIT
jgi:hypothetical protein